MRGGRDLFALFCLDKKDRAYIFRGWFDSVEKAESDWSMKSFTGSYYVYKCAPLKQGKKRK